MGNPKPLLDRRPLRLRYGQKKHPCSIAKLRWEKERRQKNLAISPWLSNRSLNPLPLTVMYGIFCTLNRKYRRGKERERKWPKITSNEYPSLSESRFLEKKFPHTLVYLVILSLLPHAFCQCRCHFTVNLGSFNLIIIIEKVKTQGYAIVFVRWPC